MVKTPAIADDVKRFTVELSSRVHSAMRELARRKRVQIGVLYEEALMAYLEQTRNYMGKERKVK